jgi:hypothetical protein
MPETRRRISLLAKAKHSQAAPAGPAALLSEKIASLVDTYERLVWPHDVVSAMQTLKTHADDLQALIDVASTSGFRIGELAATMDATPVRNPPGRVRRAKAQKCRAGSKP